MNAEESNPFDRTDAAFLEWLLSDHPVAIGQRRHQRAEFTAWRTAERQEAWAFVDRVEADPDAPDDLLGRAAIIRSMVRRADLRAEVEDAFDDGLQVIEDRRQWEIHIRVTHHDPLYTYPRHYLGADAAECPPQI